MHSKIGIIGTGGFAREVLCLINDLGRMKDVVYFLEKEEEWEKNWKNKKIMGIPVKPMSDFLSLENPTIKIVVGIGIPRIRRTVVRKLPATTRYETLIHPSAIISPWVEIGEGSIICGGCILTCNIKLGQQVHLNLHTTVGHDCVIGSYVTTAPGTNISGTCTIGDSVYFGTSSATKQGISIIENTVIGMGAMVTKNIEEQGTYVGIPAKKR